MNSMVYSRWPSWWIFWQPTNCFRSMLALQPFPGVLVWGALLGVMYTPLVAVYYVAAEHHLSNTLLEISIGGFFDFKDISFVDGEVKIQINMFGPALGTVLLTWPIGLVIGICLQYIQAFFMVMALHAFKIEGSFAQAKLIVGWSFYAQAILIALVGLSFAILAMVMIAIGNSETVPTWFNQTIPSWVIGLSIVLPFSPLLLCWYVQWQGIAVLSNLSRGRSFLVLLMSNAVYVLALAIIFLYVQLGVEP